MGIALPFEQRFSMGFPQQRGTASMVGLQADNQGAVIIGVELGPVHGDYDLATFSEHIGHTIGEGTIGADGVRLRPLSTDSTALVACERIS